MGRDCYHCLLRHIIFIFMFVFTSLLCRSGLPRRKYKNKFNKSHIKRGSWAEDKTSSRLFPLRTRTYTHTHIEQAGGKKGRKTLLNIFCSFSLLRPRRHTTFPSFPARKSNKKAGTARKQISIMPRRKRVREPKGETTQINFIIGRNYCAILFNFSMLLIAMRCCSKHKKRKTEEKRNEAQSEEKCNKWSRSERETANMSPVRTTLLSELSRCSGSGRDLGCICGWWERGRIVLDAFWWDLNELERRDDKLSEKSGGRSSCRRVYVGWIERSLGRDWWRREKARSEKLLTGSWRLGTFQWLTAFKASIVRFDDDFDGNVSSWESFKISTHFDQWFDWWFDD